jgi:sulfur carrier protein
MTLSFNGESREFAAPLSLSALLQQLGYAPGTVAAAVNGQFIPRSRYAQIELADGDRVDVVAPMQGG